jgi:very-short-patch-repair endonuclease
MKENSKEENERLRLLLAACKYDMVAHTEKIAYNTKIVSSLKGTGRALDTDPMHFDPNMIIGMNKWDKIRLFYKQCAGELKKDWLLSKDGRVRMKMQCSEFDTSHFGFNFYKEFSPAEDIAWDIIIRYRVFLLPQFPVKRYFVDFANPFLKIAIEIDGKQWHKDTEKDKDRQSDMEQDGWRFVRFSAIDTMTSKEEAFENEFGISFEDGEMLPNDEFVEMWKSLRFKNFECFCWWELDEKVFTEGNAYLLSF